jgi:hypothetical protein
MHGQQNIIFWNIYNVVMLVYSIEGKTRQQIQLGVLRREALTDDLAGN